MDSLLVAGHNTISVAFTSAASCVQVYSPHLCLHICSTTDISFIFPPLPGEKCELYIFNTNF